MSKPGSAVFSSRWEESSGAFFAIELTHCFLFQEDETKPEDCIPDVPGNEHAREFLAHAPTKGLWMPLGKEVKVMQCWRCKRHMKIPCMTSFVRIKDMKRI